MHGVNTRPKAYADGLGMLVAITRRFLLGMAFCLIELVIKLSIANRAASVNQPSTLIEEAKMCIYFPLPRRYAVLDM